MATNVGLSPLVETRGEDVPVNRAEVIFVAFVAAHEIVYLNALFDRFEDVDGVVKKADS